METDPFAPPYIDKMKNGSSQSTCFMLDKVGTRARLYVAEISTCDVLGIFAADAPIKVTVFEAASETGKGWVSKEDLPKLPTVGDMIHHLSPDNGLALIDFDVEIGDDASFSTHDDAEACFLFAREARAVEVLRALLDRDTCQVIATSVLGKPWEICMA